MNYSELVKGYLNIVNRELYDTIQQTSTFCNKILGGETSITPVDYKLIKLLEVLSRGIVVCDNDNVSNKNFLLTGINPSFGEHDPIFPFSVGCHYTFKKATTPESGEKIRGFWRNKKNQFGGLCNEIAYLDLFPLRETHQDEGFEKLFRENNVFRGKLLEVTQGYIQDLSPKLIVHANRSSMYYWGTNNDWMGYKLHKIEKRIDGMPECITNERLIKFPMYRIEGYSEHPGRINIGKENNNLIGSYLIEYVMEYRKAEERELLYNEDKEDEKKKDWSDIFDWVMNQH